MSSNTSLPGCDNFAFQDVQPSQSRAFYGELFKRGQAEAGMVSFEPDFMNQNYNCVPDFVRDVVSAPQWQSGMDGAAADLGMTIQWCYSAPSDALAAASLSSVTNLRVSDDFCYGLSWDIGRSGLLPAALGLATSKDTLWSTDNNRTAVHGCNWTPDHEAVAAELHVILALMSTGPVGVSDGIGMSNVSLLQRTIAVDGTLLKPSRPITEIDSVMALGTAHPKGYVLGTHTAASSGSHAHVFVSFKIKQSWNVTAADFYPRLASERVVHRRFDGAECTNQSDTAKCVQTVEVGAAAAAAAAAAAVAVAVGGGGQLAVFAVPAFSRVENGSDFAPAVTTVWPVCEESGVALLGELRKYVATSEVRFSGVACTATGVDFVLHGAAGEVVSVTTATVGGKVDVQRVVIPACSECTSGAGSPFCCSVMVSSVRSLGH